MKYTLHKYLFLLLLPFCLLTGIRASASHFYGADFYYTWVSGTTYTVTLAVYGDCGGSSFPSLSSATPEVQIRNGTTLVTTIYLAQVGTAVDVTPVCPAQASNTRCANALSTLPGVKRYIYAANYTLGSTSASWTFRFTGNHVTATAGRSNTITNINTGSVTVLEAKLNNVSAPNSSVNYTTIPTPFFCINKAANYNPGAVDPNLDSLSFSLVTGLSTTTGTVTYISPYTATAPLAVSTGMFFFSATNGQLAFTPNAVQRSLVVSQVAEYRNNVLVGTSMREMTFVVLGTCNNNPPGGVVSNASPGVTGINSTTVAACAAGGLMSFQINPIDSDGDHITMQVAGLPAGAAFGITGNGGYAPSGTFTWNITSVAPGTYNFFITFTDDGCPLASRQSVAYTIVVHGHPLPGYSFISAATCAAKAKFSLTPSGGVPPYTVSISGGSVADTFRSVSGTVVDSVWPGTYTVSTVSSIGCVYDTVITLAAPSAISLSGTIVSPTCVGGANGSITATGANGILPYTYAIGSGAFSSANTFTGLAAGTYAVYVKDAGGCTANLSVAVVNPADIYGAVSLSRPTCNFFADGAVSISGYNSVSPYTYALGTGIYSSAGSFSGLAAGLYTLHVRNGVGCIKDTVVILTDSLKITTTLPVLSPLCFGNANGAVTILASGAIPPYTYAINTGGFGTANTFSGLAAGTYTVHVRDTAQCFLDTTITIFAPAALKIAPAVTAPVNCNGGNDGIVSVSATGGTPSYTYAVGAGAYGAAGVFTGLAAGSYTFHVKDAHNCISDSVVAIAQPAPVAITATKTNVLCNGSTTGSVTITASGGTPPYTYAADAGTYGTSNIVTGLNAGTHVIHTKDAAGCIRDTAIALTEPPAILIGYTATQPLCMGTSTGTVTISGNGGTPPYAYAVDAGSFASTSLLTGLPAGTHMLHIRDANGCLKDSLITIGEPTAITVTAAVKLAHCTPLADGAVWLYPSGGTPGYTYAVGSGLFGSSGQFNNLGSGMYVFHIMDAAGCIRDTAIGVGDSVFVHAGYAVTSVSCYGGSDGTATISPFGGDLPYTYAMNASTYGTGNPVMNLAAGTYMLHVMDANGCVLDTPLSIAQPAQIAPSVVITEPRCNGGIGSIRLTANGGSPGYTYANGSGAYSGNGFFNNLVAGTYTLHVKDANNCIGDTTVAMGQPTIISIDSVHVTHVKCSGTNSGTVTVFSHGGTPPYSYARNNAAYVPGNLLTGFYAGLNVVHVRDAAGCIMDTAVRFSEPLQLHFGVPAIKLPTCEGFKDGSIAMSAFGGTPQYQYAVDARPYKATDSFNNLGEGTHICHVRDSNLCIFDTTVILTGYPHIVLRNPEITPPACYGFGNGVINLNASGGIPPLTYHSVSPDVTNSTGIFGALRKGSYTFSITDAKGCRKDTTLIVAQPPVLDIVATGTPNDCEGIDDGGQVTTIATGGTEPYAYSWSSGQHTDALKGVTNGRYRVTVTDAHGCRDSSLAEVGYDDCCKPFIPDAFTPNGDGRNDIYRLRWKGDVSKLQFSVYNRYGERVFVSYQTDIGWDGTYHGRPCDVGVYFYLVRFICGKGDHEVAYKGDVTLIR